ncbi:MAG TPA: ABC transporter substrate-binding protein [Acidimicrobiales bacterium]|nr:ABC transporter substrate-binding protein [Acidimicrobiales bacterium]
MTRKWVVLTSVCVLALGLAACGSSSSSKSSGTTGGSTSGAVKGGTLTMLGTGDVDYMDPNISYYTTGYLALRMWSRQMLSYPAVQGHSTDLVPDLATQVPTVANGGISADGLTYKLTIRTGVMWNTTPPRQVTAADAVRGLERTCNPAQPFGGLPDFETLIEGMTTFCTAFEKAGQTVAAIQAFLNSNTLPGVTVDPSNPQTVVYTLTHPATYFPNQLAMPAFSPAPVEFLNYIPASSDLAQHTVSDGPYEIQSYNPTKSITFVRNPAWNASTDPVRKAYVDKIMVSETNDHNAIQQQLQTNTSSADMGWDSQVPIASIPALLAAKNPNLVLAPTYGTSPYVLFNTVSPNNSGALGNVMVRQALEYAINRTDLIQDDGGPQVSPPLTHILPPGIVGSQNFDPYPYDQAKGMQMLSTAIPGAHLTLKVLYQNALGYETNMFQTLQSDLGKVGITVTGVPSPSADFYTKYLEVPTVAKAGTWDLALANWFPDWYGNGALSFFEPLFAGTPAFPPSGSDFGFYNSATTNNLIQQASVATTSSQAASLWAQADMQVMADAAIFPITSPNQPEFHASQVHNTVYVPNLNQFDPTNVWLSGA